MSKDLLVLADEYAAATATFARALALKDEADSMSPIAREAGDKRAVLAEALAALDTAQQEPVNAMLVEALERMVESVTGVDQVSAVNQARTALAALRAQPVPEVGFGNIAQPADPFKKLSDEEVLWIAQSHGIDVYACNTLAFYNDLISTTQAKPGHSELVKDAARYRWLREQHWSDSKFAVVSNPKTAVNLGSICPSRELLDEAIDAAIGETME